MYTIIIHKFHMICALFRSTINRCFRNNGKFCNQRLRKKNARNEVDVLPCHFAAHGAHDIIFANKQDISPRSMYYDVITQSITQCQNYVRKNQLKVLTNN